MFRPGLYARMSSEDQRTLPMQLRAMRHYAAKRGWAVASQMREVGFRSGTAGARDELLDATRRAARDYVRLVGARKRTRGSTLARLPARASSTQRGLSDDVRHFRLKVRLNCDAGMR